MSTLLLVEDNKFIRHLIKDRLEQHDIVVLEAASGKRSLEILKQYPVDIILLDLGLPDGSGLDFIPDIRKHSNTPLIIVSADKNKEKKLKGFRLGADDYICKPFDADELVARIQACMRRYNEPANERPIRRKTDDSTRMVTFGAWTLDRVRFQIFDKSGNSGNLTLQEFQLLESLITNAGKVMNRDDLYRCLYADNSVPSPRAIDVKVTRIRKKIGDDPQNPYLIKTIRGAGYIFEKDNR